jgi:hypothetical protein
MDRNNLLEWQKEQDLEEALKLLIATHDKISTQVSSPEIAASASLTFGISRFAETMGDRCAATILEQTADMLRRRCKPLN